jgi:hypothetical protein
LHVKISLKHIAKKEDYIMQNNKTVTTYFNEEELYNQLREVSHDLD